jgi:hypothetical protein
VKTLRMLFAIARADVLERVRRYSFLVTLVATAWLGWLVVRGQIILLLDVYYGEMNGAWAGTLVAVTLSTLVSLVGFWIVKGSVERDRRTRLGEILAAAPMSKTTYTLGKFLSNFAVLAAIVAALALAAPILVLAKGGAGLIDPWATLSPFLLIALPTMAVVAALAVLFETFRPLSGGAGNVLWFFLWSAMLAVPMSTASPRLDLTGLMLVQESAGAAAKAAYPEYDGGFSLTVGGGIRDRLKGPFRWDGIEWTAARLAHRFAWFGAAILIVLVAAVPFDRFDESRRKQGSEGTLHFFASKRYPGSLERKRGVSLPIPSFLPPVFVGELRLMLNGRAWWFWAVFAGLIVAGAATPLDVSRGRILPFAWLWPILVWSAMGAREARDGTEELVFTAPRPLLRQLPAVYLAGVTVALAAGSGVALKCLMTASFEALGGWFAGVVPGRMERRIEALRGGLHRPLVSGPDATGSGARFHGRVKCRAGGGDADLLRHRGSLAGCGVGCRAPVQDGPVGPACKREKCSVCSPAGSQKDGRGLLYPP